MSDQKDNLAAVISEKHAKFTVEKREIPKPGEDELLVRNHAIAANPVDWQIQTYGLDFITRYPNVLGSDACGEVVSVGGKVTKFKPGDRVTGYAGAIYNNNPDHGAYQTYTVLRELATVRIPDSMSYEQGAALSMAGATAAVGLFVDLGLPRTPDASPTDTSSLLVWGASGSVGSMALQVAKTLGWTVFATAGKSNHDMVKKLGAAQVFDHRDPDVVDKIVAAAEAAGKPVRQAFDAVSQGEVFDQVTSVVKKSASKGAVAGVLDWPKDKKAVDGVVYTWMLAYRHATDQSEIGTWFFNEFLQEKLESGDIVSAPPVEVIDGGIESAQKLLDTLKNGVSAKKLVIQVA